jgi:FMN reductase
VNVAPDSGSAAQLSSAPLSAARLSAAPLSAAPLSAAPHLVIATSLSSESRSTRLARLLVRALEEAGQPDTPLGTLLVLRDLELPLCDGDASQRAPAVLQLSRLIRAARTITLAVPIYNYDVGPSARNLVALVGDAFRDKPVALLCAAGGPRAYMAALGLGNSLMLDFRCLIVPRFVYASARGDGGNDELSAPEIELRITQLAADLMRFAELQRSWQGAKWQGANWQRVAGSSPSSVATRSETSPR